MGVAGFIARRPIVVIAVWLVVALVALPLFAKLGSIVEERQYTLPENSEAMNASKLLEKLGSSDGVGVIVVTGVDLLDNDTVLRLVEWGKAFNETVSGRYMTGVTGLPMMLAGLNETLYAAMLSAVNETASRTLQLYEALDSLDKAYAAALENATKQVELLNQSLIGLVEADRGYARAYQGLLELVPLLNKTINGLVQLDAALADTTSQLLELAAKLNKTALGLVEADRFYSGLYRNLTLAAGQLAALFSNETPGWPGGGCATYTLLEVSRAYFYLEAYNGSYEAYAEAANLTSIDPALVPLPREEALAAWQAVKQLVEQGVDPDTAASRVAANMLAGELPATATYVLPVAVDAWLGALQGVKASMNVSSLTDLYKLPPEHVESQLQVLNAAREAARQAAESIAANRTAIVAELLAKQLEVEGLPESIAEQLAAKAAQGALEPLDAALVVAGRAAEEMGLPANATELLARVLVEADPAASLALASSPDKAVEAAAKLLEAFGVPGDAVEAAKRILQEGAMDRRVAAREAVQLLAGEVPAEAKQLLQVLPRYDPEAEGLLAANKTLAAMAAGDIVYEQMTEMGQAILPRYVVTQLSLLVAEGAAEPGQLRKIALSIVENAVAAEAGEERAKLIAAALERFDPDASGRIASNTTLALEAVAWMAEQQGLSLPFTVGELREMLESREALRRTMAEILKEEAVENAPEEAKPLLEKLADIVAVEGPGIPEERKWSIVEKLVREAAAGKMAGAAFEGFEVPDWLADATIELGVKVARGELAAETAAGQLAERLLLEAVYPRLLNETRGLLVASDYNGFLVMGTPLGDTGEERADNTVEAGRTAEELLKELGISYERAYVSGNDLLLKQVKEYAGRDAEKTSKFSELGTFIVLLVILESLFAVILPYIGIFLGLAVGGALVYIAASMGWIEVSSTTQSLMIATALGLGADYAGYIVHRFREEYARLQDPREAARRALERAGPAVVASALTVIIGFGSLMLGWEIGFLSNIGETIPITVAATAAASLTLVPALLSLFGGRSWFWWPRRPSIERLGRESRLMRTLIRYEPIVLAVILAAMIGSAYFYVTFKGSHDMKLLLPDGAPALQAFDVLREEFTPGITDPVYVVAVLPESIWESNTTAKMLDELAAKLAEVPGVAKVISPTQLASSAAVFGQTAGMMGGLVSSDGRIAVVQVMLSVDPYSSEGEKAIEKVHEIAHSYAEQHGFKVYVGGAPYAVLEMDDILHRVYYRRILPAASLLMIAVFTGIFGSLVASIAALLVIIGSAMMGIAASVILFQDLLGKPVLWFLHIVSMAAVLGVGMDYNSFYLARALEEYHRGGGDAKKAVARAAGAVSTFIVGLAFVVTSAYLALLSASNIGMREMGFTLAVTVLLAGLMAAYLLTPLVISMLGRHAWWPWGLRRRISH
ncbi:MMPL family transporter [Hyperthermus butylicus]|uniref:Exporter of RND superfamily n=1 Tax=Hyperthermus butylicus (strain DSM 5456 / JCM 9403 / PLM1-5) TaxID=415426 RepID=A2BKI4_HYPBU|nr:MMPL family transporter [Hyperthermus butylicus]ABM80495.1 putative exporter of RND superfamily [Hyperthermus butylicus DSM 5456]